MNFPRKYTDYIEIQNRMHLFFYPMQKKRCTYRRKTDYSSCKASAGFTRIACAAGNQIPAITIKVIRKKVISVF